MASSEVFTSKTNGALWIQPAGPNSKPEFLPCHDLEDISETNGSITLIQCINERGEFETIGATVGAPEPTTTTLGTYIGRVADFIETVRCPFGLYVMLSCGKKGVFENWERAMLIQVQAVTGRTRSGLVRKDEDVPAMHTFDIEASPGVTDFFRLTSAAQALEAGFDTGLLTSTRFSDDIACWDDCGESRDVCEDGVATTTAQTDTFGKVLLSPQLSGTAEWTVTATDPFIATMDVADALIIKVGRSTTRLIVANGTTQVAANAQIAYSDDNGATWISVDVGTTVAEFFTKKGVLFAISPYEIYAVSNLGRIYKSEDKGISWTVKEDANITGAEYNAVHMLNSSVGFAVGTSGLVVKTVDGGKTWGQTGAVAGANDLFSVFALSRSRIWVGSTLGVMLFTEDGGETWATRQLADATANVNDMVWSSDYNAYVANGETAQFTINGGYTFETIEDTTNLHSSDMVSVNYCSERQVYNVSTDTIVQSAS